MQPTLGQRIFQLRTERHPPLTQEAVAERAGISVDVIRKLEQGRKQSARLTTLSAIANALDADLSDLVGKPSTLASVPDQGGLLQLRRAITPVGSSVDTNPPPLSDSGELWDLYWRGEYDALAAILPAVINYATGDALAEALQVAASMLMHIGHGDLGHAAVMRAQQTVEDPHLHTALVGTLGWVLLKQNRADDAATVAVRGADAAEPRLTRASPPEVSLWGNLLVVGASANARAGDYSTARELLRGARAAAEWLGRDRNDRQTTFGPAQVVMQSVDVAVVSGDYAGALAAAQQMSPGNRLPLAASARHRTDVAHALVQLGRLDEAEQVITAVARAAPVWIGYQAFPRAVVADLLSRRRRPTGQLLRLARRLGVAAA